ncbi:alpha/beta hydrolase [Dyella koreensis]|uniref:Alpha/beta fold hydrolase n=1 Tax=Dyella koreensis TaxID=311235 RepID=A0ABW8K8D9_9GAMM
MQNQRIFGLAMAAALSLTSPASCAADIPESIAARASNEGHYDGANSIGLVAVPSIAWESCEKYTYNWFELGDRMLCGKVAVPVDYDHPDAGTMQVSVIKIAASRSDRHRGVIVVNPGGPGALTGLTFAQDVFGFWSAGDPNNPAGALLKQITEDYDIVGFLPRGTGTSEALVGSGDTAEVSGPGDYALNCHSDQTIPDFIDPDDRSSANIVRMQDKARVIANGCQGVSRAQAAYVNTERTVRDIDVIRQALKEECINFYGTSYGTWMGAWYAILFPGHTDRLVLDSSMDFTRSFDVALVNQIRSIQSVVDLKLIPEIISRPDYYHLGSNPSHIGQLMASLPPKVRRIVRNSNIGDLLSATSNPGLALTAAQGVAALLKENPGIDKSTMLSLVRQHVFSNDYEANGTARFRARGMVNEYFSDVDDQPLNLDVSSSVYNAVSCNDAPLGNTYPQYWASLGSLLSSPSLAVDTEDVTGNPCIYWSDQYSAHKPTQDMLSRLPPTLMLQLQYDPLTPLSGARSLHYAIRNSSLVTIEDGVGHGVIAKGNECASKLIGEYFINRTLPAPETVCTSNGQRNASMYADPTWADTVRGKLQETINTSNHWGVFK